MRPYWMFRKGIQSERIRAIPKSVSEPIRKTFYISFDEKRPKINPTSSDSFQFNARHQSEFGLDQSELGLIKIEPESRLMKIG